MEKANLASVAIDGTKIKNIRELKKLTQLYVASVVGVTTDTISRWENNRYPTIKRDNAEKLAAALGVPLSEILRQEADVLPQEAPPPVAEPVNRRRFLMLLLLALVLLVAAVFLIVVRRPAAPVAVRWLPHFAAPGEAIPVQIRVQRSDGDGKGFILKERLPPGWRLMNAVPPTRPGGAAAEEAKWLIPAGKDPVTVSYMVQLPEGAALQSKGAFTGKIIISSTGINSTEPVGGADGVTVGPFHWADANGDGRIDDNEIMPAYYLTEELKGLDLDWTTIEAIWSGKGYVWNRDRRSFSVIN